MRRSAATFLVALAILLTSAVAATAQTGSSVTVDKPSPSPCLPVIAVACGLAGGALDLIGGAASDVIGAGASAVGGTVLDGISSWVGQGASWLIERIGQQVERSTRPELGATWFTEQYQGMLSLALILALAFLLAALTQAALRQDLGVALRAAFVALPVALIACFAAVTLVELLLAATDDATRLLTQQTGDDSREFFDDLATSVVPSGASPLPGFLAMLGALLAALLCIVVWIELILREAAVYLAVAFLPLSLAAMVWQRTAHLARRLIEGLAGVILAKLAIAVAVAFAASALSSGGEGPGGLTTMLAGCAVLFLAALSPWILMRLIPLSGDAGIHRGSVKQALHTAPGASTAALVVRTGMYSAFSAGRAPTAVAAGATQAASPPPPAWHPTGGAGRLPVFEPSQPERPSTPSARKS